MLIGVDEGSALIASSYVRMMLPGVLLNSFADSIDLFLIPLGYTIPICLLQLAVVPFHIFFCWLFVHKLDRGVVGAAIAHNITASLTILFLCSYVSFQKEIKDAWYLPTKKTFHNLKEFLDLAIPGVLMLLLENTNMQIMLLLAGTLGSDDLAAA
jgi:MATE family multidrug resistance protein